PETKATGAVTNIDVATQRVERERGTEKDEKYQKKSSKSVRGTGKGVFFCGNDPGIMIMIMMMTMMMMMMMPTMKMMMIMIILMLILLPMLLLLLIMMMITMIMIMTTIGVL
ncbi:unnamed protein product, partial [Porites evermanni]